MEFKLGNKDLLAGFEECVVGMKIGETEPVTLEP